MVLTGFNQPVKTGRVLTTSTLRVLPRDMTRNTAPMILVPVSRLMQQQHASSRVQCDILEPPAPAPESALSGIVSLMMSQSILESEVGYFSLLVQCDIFCPQGVIGSLSLSPESQSGD